MSPGSKGLKLRSHASHKVRENGKKRSGSVTARINPAISNLVHGGFGHCTISHTIGTPIAITSPATRLKTYAPIQKSESSPRCSASPQTGHWSFILNQFARIPGPPHRGQWSHSARKNFLATDDLGGRTKGGAEGCGAGAICITLAGAHPSPSRGAGGRRGCERRPRPRQQAPTRSRSRPTAPASYRRCDSDC